MKQRRTVIDNQTALPGSLGHKPICLNLWIYFVGPGTQSTSLLSYIFQGAAPVKSSEPATTSVKQGKSEVVQDARYTKVMTGEPRIQTVDISVQSKKPESSELRRFLTSQAVVKPGSVLNSLHSGQTHRIPLVGY